MQFLYLDSYYFYAPIPRVLWLREKLGKTGIRGYRLLYMQFSSPSYFLKSLTRVIAGYSVTSIAVPAYSTTARRGGRGGALKPLEKFLKILGPLFSGRERSKTINVLHLARLVGEEQAAILDFLIFLYSHAERAERIIAEGACDARVERRVPRHVAKQL